MRCTKPSRCLKMPSEGQSEAGGQHPALRNADQLAWAVWVGGRKNRDCFAVVADSEAEAKEKALDEADDKEEVLDVDGPFQDGEPAYYEFTYVTEHRETVVVEAPNESYAKETAEAGRSYNGEYMTTNHTDVHRVEKE